MGRTKSTKPRGTYREGSPHNFFNTVRRCGVDARESLSAPTAARASPRGRVTRVRAGRRGRRPMGRAYRRGGVVVPSRGTAGHQ